MNNKAFTLVELLGVIFIISVIAILVFPAVENVIRRSSDTVYQTQINTILKSTYDLTLAHREYLPSNDSVKYITLGELKAYGLIDSDIKNPKTNEEFSNNLVISIEYVNTNYDYDKTVSKLEGNYLYTVLVDNLESDDSNPTIELIGLTQNSDSNYIITLNLNESINILCTAESESGVDLTSRVKAYITNNGTVVDRIDSSTSAIYKVNYSVVDDDGHATSVVLNVIVADTTKPEITLPKANTISTSVSNYNLMKDVSCTDNSGFCTITYTGTINYGTSGKYIIEYTAQDPSGNTSTLRRVITVE